MRRYVLVLLVLVLAAGCVSDAPETPEPSVAFHVPEEPVPAGLVSLTVLSDPPFSSVLVDGQYTGMVTPGTLSLVPGTYTVSVESSSGRTAEQTVTLIEDTTVSLSVSRDPARYGRVLSDTDLTGTGYAVFRSSQPYVHILINGRQITGEGVKTPYIVPALRAGDQTFGILDSTGKWSEFGSNEGTFSIRSRLYTPVNFAKGSDTLETHTLSSPAYTGFPYSAGGEISGDRIPGNRNWWKGYTYLSVQTQEGIISFPRVLSWGTDITLEPRDAVWSQVTVTSVPSGADILIDGFPIGKTTPWTVANISDGMHKVMVTKPGYLPAERDLYLPAESGTTAVDFGELTPYTNGYLVVDSGVPGAFVMIHGRDTGDRTPVVYPAFPIGETEVTVITGSGKSVTEHVTVLPDRVTRVMAEF
jgi:hypothetical protein